MQMTLKFLPAEVLHFFAKEESMKIVKFGAYIWSVDTKLIKKRLILDISTKTKIITRNQYEPVL